MSEEPQDSGAQVMEAAAPVDSVTDDLHTGEEQKEAQMVPLDALQSERTQRQNLQDELRVIKDHIALMQAQQTSQQQQKPTDEMDAMADDDVLTVGEAKKFLKKMNNQYQSSIEEMKMVQKHPDYQDVVQKYLPEVLKQNPKLRSTLEQSQDYDLAYYLAKNSDTYKSDMKTGKKNQDAERIMQNSQKAGSLSSVGSTAPMNTAKRYKEMNETDFKSLVNRNMGSF
ncbi:MAG: hypothetical protein K1000chlam2_00018 [Chlamydiae bacterium]|nr:hypothetical protein [Chlamydiota bacterium]